MTRAYMAQWLNWRAFERAIEAGYRYAQVKLRDWK